LGTLSYNFFVDEFLPNLIKEKILIQKGRGRNKKKKPTSKKEIIKAQMDKQMPLKNILAYVLNP
jgi:hypothetical protein